MNFANDICLDLVDSDQRDLVRNVTGGSGPLSPPHMEHLAAVSDSRRFPYRHSYCTLQCCNWYSAETFLWRVQEPEMRNSCHLVMRKRGVMVWWCAVEFKKLLSVKLNRSFVKWHESGSGCYVFESETYPFNLSRVILAIRYTLKTQRGRNFCHILKLITNSSPFFNVRHRDVFF